MNRRHFLHGLAGLTVLSQLPACNKTYHATGNPLAFVSAGKLVKTGKAEEFVVVGLGVDANIIWQTALPERAHASTISPDGSVMIVTGRRPSKRAWLIDSKTGRILQTIHANKNRHFFGHSIFDANGEYLYSTENDTVNLVGKISKRAVKNPQTVLHEYDSFGVGCHELHLLPDNKTLVVANGGIKTAENSRKKLNLNSMQPNLAYIDLVTGQCLQKLTPLHHQLSVRHIDVANNGTVAIGMQFQGDASKNLPLLFTHKLGQPTLQAVETNDDDWRFFKQYIGSVTILADGTKMMATSPKGNCAVLVNVLNNKIEKKLALRDCCGVALSPTSSTKKVNDFFVSDGIGQISPIHINGIKTQIDSNHVKSFQHIQFDNHMTSYSS